MKEIPMSKIVQLNTPWVAKQPPERRQPHATEDTFQETEIIIDEELANLIPPLTVSEEHRLKKSLKQDGCREPLTVWKGKLIDGHNRYRYCKANNIPFKVVEKHFSDKDEAKLWMVENQMARRNLTKAAYLSLEDTRQRLVARLAKERQESTQFQEGNKSFQKNLTVPPILGEPSKDREQETNRQMSKITGIAHGTVAKYNYVRDNAERLDEADIIQAMLVERGYEEDGKINKMTISRAYNKLKQKERQEELRHKGYPLNKYEVIYVDSEPSGWNLTRKHPVKEMSKHNAILFLWSTEDEIKQAMDTMEQWGFNHERCCIWKHNEIEEFHGFETCHDILLIGSKGDFHHMCPRNKLVLFPSLFHQDKGEGYQRPKEYKQIIHKLYPDLVKVDLIGDNTTEGWENYNQEENAKNLWR